MEGTALTIFGTACFLWASLAGRQALEMRKSHDYRSSWAWAFWAALPPSVFALLSFSGGSSDLTARNITLGVMGAIMGSSVLIWAGYAMQRLPTQPQSPPHQGIPMPENKPAIPQISTGSGNFSINQQGGSLTQNYINQVPEKLKFTDALCTELLAKIGKDKPLRIIAVGSSSDQIVGQQINTFLRANGYETSLMTVGVMGPPPDQALTLSEFPNARQLVVAPSIR